MAKDKVIGTMECLICPGETAEVRQAMRAGKPAYRYWVCQCGCLQPTRGPAQDLISQRLAAGPPKPEPAPGPEPEPEPAPKRSSGWEDLI